MALHAIREDIDPAPGDDLKKLLSEQRAAHRKHPYPSLSERREHLRKLERMVLDNKKAIQDAISEDFGWRSPKETEAIEVLPTVLGIRDAIRHLNAWMRPERRRVHPAFWLARAKIEYQPLGVVGVISPWNYPLLLALSPVAGALAAGNRVMIKPSEYTPKYSELLAKLVAETFERDHVTVCPGGVDVAQAFSGLAFDHLLFTGSTSVGRHVMRAAADNLVPVTLELGGKSPTVIDRNFPVERAVDQIMVGKLLNSSQTCVAPDYVFVHSSQRDALVEAIKTAVARLYPNMATNEDYSGIATDRHFERLQDIVADAQQKGAEAIELNPGDQPDEAFGRKFKPTLVLDPKEEMTCLQEELFGPILPIKTYEELDEVIEYINDHDRPLALYVFTDDGAVKDKFTSHTVSGALVLNTTIVHVGVDDLPFGGVGASGMGVYHGREGFKTFSHAKPMYEQIRLNGVGLLHPPYGKTFRTVLDTLLGK